MEVERSIMMLKNYFSYLVRVWRNEDPLQSEWFASVEEPSTQQIIQFRSLDDLFKFIQEKSISGENPSNDAIPETNQFAGLK